MEKKRKEHEKKKRGGGGCPRPLSAKKKKKGRPFLLERREHQKRSFCDRADHGKKGSKVGNLSSRKNGGKKRGTSAPVDVIVRGGGRQGKKRNSLLAGPRGGKKRKRKGETELTKTGRLGARWPSRKRRGSLLRLVAPRRNARGLRREEREKEGSGDGRVSKREKKKKKGRRDGLKEFGGTRRGKEKKKREETPVAIIRRGGEKREREPIAPRGQIADPTSTRVPAAKS